MSGLPKGWGIVPLKDIASSVKGKKPKTLSDIKTDGTVPYIDIRAFDKGEIRQYADILSSNIATKEDVLVVWDGARSGLVGIGQEGAIGSTLAAIRPSAIMSEYLYRFLQTQYEQINSNPRGTGIPHVDPEVFWNIELSIAPLPEQRRIIAKLEKLLHKVDASRERLDKIPAILKRFRQSVLAAACSGRLTADWRENNPDCVGAPLAGALTGRVQDPPLQGEGEGLPGGWKWVPLQELLPSGGIFDGPFGSNLKTSDYTNAGVRVIRLENIGHLNFIEDKQTYISDEKYRTLERHTVGEGDIIFASFISDEIRVCVLPRLEPAIAKADCFCLRPKEDLVDRVYLSLQLVSRESYNVLLDEVHGATRPRINTTQLKKLYVRFCPLPEQQEIVRRVEALFKKADEIEARYKKAKGFVDRLTQSILAKAFRGELVPQDPNDEPAAALLYRIRAERGKQEPKRRGRQKR